MILHRANGGYSNRPKGILIGNGNMIVEMTSPMMVLKMERRYPTMVAVLELLMNICTKLVNAT